MNDQIEYEYAMSIFCPEDYIKIHKGSILALGLEAAAMLHYLIYYRNEMVSPGQREGSWVYCPSELINEELDMSDQQQQQVFNRLILEGAIEKAYVGSHRYIQINENKLKQYVHQYFEYCRQQNADQQDFEEDEQ